MAKAFWDKGYRLVIFSGRSASTQFETERWLDSHDIKYDMLKMRPTHKKWFPDDILKKEMLDRFVDKKSVFLVVDDRQKVVDMWRKEGLTCFQVAEGNF